MTAGARLSPQLRASLRHRLRHIHIPDLAPLYAPRFLPGRLRDHLEHQICEQRLIAADADSDSAPNGEGRGDAKDDGAASSDLTDELRSWLRRASPPPTVLSFTRRPTYVLPKQYLASAEPWEVDYLTNSLKGQMQVTFPEPPGWSSLPWRPFWEADKDEEELSHHPLSHSWVPGVLVMPCAEPMFFGPGQLSIWPVIDLRDHVQRGKKFRTKYELERLLEDTTIEVLQREYGIAAFTIPGSPGVWVNSAIPPGEVSALDAFHADTNGRTRQTRDNVRRIATIHADVVNDITRFGLSIHVGSPAPFADAWTATSNPWIPLRQHMTTTSIAAELTHTGFTQRQSDPEQGTNHRSGRKTKYLHTYFDEKGPFVPTSSPGIPFTSVLTEAGRRMPAPLGMDNRDLSSAWTYEFARQLGMRDGVIDHFSKTNYVSRVQTELPTKERNIGFMSWRVAVENVSAEPYEEVEVPVIQLREAGPVTKTIIQDTKRIEAKDLRLNLDQEPPWAISWPMYYSQLTKTLDKSIKGLMWDTRLSDFLWQKEKNAKRERRQQMLEEAETLEARWQYEPKSQLIRRPLTDPIVGKLAKNTLEIQEILRTLELGGPWKRRLFNQTVQMLKVLRSRYAVQGDRTGTDKTAEQDANQETPGGETSQSPNALNNLMRLTRETFDDATAKLPSAQPVEDEQRPRPNIRSPRPLQAWSSPLPSPPESSDAGEAPRAPAGRPLRSVAHISGRPLGLPSRPGGLGRPHYQFTPTREQGRRAVIAKKPLLQYTRTLREIKEAHERRREAKLDEWRKARRAAEADPLSMLLPPTRQVIGGQVTGTATRRLDTSRPQQEKDLRAAEAKGDKNIEEQPPS